MFNGLDPQGPRETPLRHFTEAELLHLEDCGTITGAWCARMIACYRHLHSRVTMLEAELAEAGRCHLCARLMPNHNDNCPER